MKFEFNCTIVCSITFQGFTKKKKTIVIRNIYFNQINSQQLIIYDLAG